MQLRFVAYIKLCTHLCSFFFWFTSVILMKFQFTFLCFSQMYNYISTVFPNFLFHTTIHTLQGPPRSQLGLKRKEPTSNSQVFPEHQASSSCLVLRNQPAVLVCHACTLAFATLFHLRQHCESRRHHEKLIDFKKMGRGFSNPLSCDLCKSPGSSVLVIEGHLNGIKHAQSLMAFENKKMARAGQAWLQTVNGPSNSRSSR